MSDLLRSQHWGDTLLASWAGTSAELSGIDTDAQTARATRTWPEPLQVRPLPASSGGGPIIPLEPLPPPADPGNPPVTGGPFPVPYIDLEGPAITLGLMLAGVALVAVGLFGILSPGGRAAAIGGAVGGAVQQGVAAL